MTVSVAARSIPPAAHPRPCDVLLDGLATLITEGRDAAAPTLRAAIDLYITNQVAADDWPQWGRGATTAAFALWDVDSWAALSTRQVAVARASGALTSLVLALNFHVNVVTCCGDFDAATVLVAELDDIKESTGIAIAPFGAKVLAAYQGNAVEPARRMSATLDERVERGAGHASHMASWASAILNNGLGRYEDAFAAAREVAYGAAFNAPHILSELIEAAVGIDNLDVANDALRRLLELTITGSDWAAGVEARGRALVSGGDVAESWYRESVACLARTQLQPEHARSRLVYGEWLQRQGRLIDARGELIAARDMFTAMGMAGFADRARRGLSATGTSARHPTRETSHDLTAQEAQIASLARDGLSNAEIGAQLFVSPRTVEWHLRKVYSKLAIKRRGQLRTALRCGSDEGVPVGRAR